MGRVGIRVEELADYYKVNKVIWVEVGKGNPWLPPRGNINPICGE
jgi:hypothetical protein